MNLLLLQVQRSVVGWGTEGSKLPRSLRLLKYGDNPSSKGVIKVGQRTCAVLDENQKQQGFERVAIDYNHCTVQGADDYVPGKPAAIFGYGTPRFDSQIGLVLNEIVWTPLGEECARNYLDLSPAVQMDPNGEVCFVHSVALTTNGAIHGSEVASNILLNSANQDKRADKRAELDIVDAFQLGVPPSMAPDKLLLMAWGKDHRTGSGFISVDEDSQRRLVHEQIRLGLTRVPIFIPPLTGLNKKAQGNPELAGSGIPAVAAGVGLSLVDVQWTKLGLSALTRYSYLKPTLLYDTVLATDAGPNDPKYERVVIGIREATFSDEDICNMEAFPRFLKLNAEQRTIVMRGSPKTHMANLRRLLLSANGASQHSQKLISLQRTSAIFARQMAEALNGK